MRKKQFVIPCSYEGIQPGDVVIYTTNGMGGAHTGIGVYRGLLNDKAAIDINTWRTVYIDPTTGLEVPKPPYPRWNDPEFFAKVDAWRATNKYLLEECSQDKVPCSRRTYLQRNRMVLFSDVVRDERM